MSGIVSSTTRAAVEGFLDTGNAAQRRDAYAEFASMALAFVLALVLLSFIGKYLWNSVIVDLFTFAKPAKNIWQVLGLFVFVALIRP